MSKIYKAKVFQKDGNRMLIPGCWYEESDHANHVPILSSALMFEVVCGLSSEPDWLTFETDDDGRTDLTHVPHDIVGRQFAHGAIEVLLISGPLFDAAIQAEAA